MIPVRRSSQPYANLSDLDTLQYLLRVLPVVELLFIIQIVVRSSRPWLSLGLCFSLPSLGLIGSYLSKHFARFSLDWVWIAANILLFILCVTAGPESPTWLFGISGGMIGGIFVATTYVLKIVCVTATIVGITLGEYLAGKSWGDLLPIATGLVAFSILSLRAYSFLATINQTVLDQSDQIQQDRTALDHLLLNILPGPIIERMRSGETRIADQVDNATVLFADIVGFTTVASGVSALEVVEILDRIFSEFDRLADFYQVEKIKTIGDAYMVVSGVPEPKQHTVENMALFALDIQASMQHLFGNHRYPLQLRIGLHVGDLVAGVIGRQKLAYDLWGDTVNVASRMESHGEAGKIHCTQAIYDCLCDRFEFDPRPPIQVKGKGMMQTYFLQGRSPNHAPQDIRSSPDPIPAIPQVP